MLGLHIATMRYECQKSRFVMEGHESDPNLMVQTTGFTHCHELSRSVTMCYDCWHEFMANQHESLRSVTNTVPRCCDLLSANANCHVLSRSMTNFTKSDIYGPELTKSLFYHQLLNRSHRSRLLHNIVCI